MERRRVAVEAVSDLLSWPPKNPTDVVDCEVDWQLGDDRIISSKWAVPGGIAGARAHHDSSRTFIWLSGGELGGRYVLTNTIVTAARRKMSREIRIKIK